MLRINLLPAYIAERRRVRLAIALSVAFFVLVTGGGLGYVFGILNGQVASAQSEDATDTEAANKEKAFETQTATMLTQIAPLKDKVDFVEAIKFYNTLPGKIYRNAARFTYRRVEYNAMAVSGNNLSLSATCSSLDDIGRFYLTMFANPDVTAVSITGVPDRLGIEAAQPPIIPGGPPPAPPQYHIAMNATLVQAVAAPSLPASLNGGGAGGVGGPGGPPPGAMGPGGPPPGVNIGPGGP